MKTFVGITDSNWFNQLSELRPDEVNFWKPGGKQGFSTLEPGELFLFKLHSPDDYIVGGGHFVSFFTYPISIAWPAFGEKNGVRSRAEFEERIWKYRKGEREPDPQIGCIILNQPFFFPREHWIPAPASWPKSTVQGKTYNNLDPEMSDILRLVRQRLAITSEIDLAAEVTREHPDKYGDPYLARARLGQGAFRMLVTDAYDRRCAITGEKTLPVLQAAHIVPFAGDGTHRVNNGLLLRADMHLLYDSGLITVTPDYKIDVSSRIEEQYTNGKLYYSYRGQQLRSLPAGVPEQPKREHLEWHSRNVFVR